MSAQYVLTSMIIILQDFEGIDSDRLEPDADLLLDIGLDSIQIMQLLAELETRFEIEVPTKALDKNKIGTLQALADAVSDVVADSEVMDVVDEPELDIKVHCLVSCLCEPIRKNESIDHRPFYFCVPDADIFIDKDNCLSYHHPDVDHSFFLDWFKKLYGIRIDAWFDKCLSIAANVSQLELLLDNKTPETNLLVMLDLYRLPERENKFNKNPFPHYVMLEKTDDPEKIFMWDPDFRWEGTLDYSKVMQAVAQPCVTNGYAANYKNIKSPESALIAEYFQHCYIGDRNPMTDRVREVINYHLNDKLRLAHLPKALGELPVLAIRKYGYEYGLAFFWRALQLDSAGFEYWCEQIDVLVKGYEQVPFLVAKYLLNPVEEYLSKIHQCLDVQDKIEFAIKHELQKCFQLWQEKVRSDLEGVA